MGSFNGGHSLFKDLRQGIVRRSEGEARMVFPGVYCTESIDWGAVRELPFPTAPLVRYLQPGHRSAAPRY